MSGAITRKGRNRVFGCRFFVLCVRPQSVAQTEDLLALGKFVNERTRSGRSRSNSRRACHAVERAKTSMFCKGQIAKFSTMTLGLYKTPDNFATPLGIVYGKNARMSSRKEARKPRGGYG